VVVAVYARDHCELDADACIIDADHLPLSFNACLAPLFTKEKSDVTFRIDRGRGVTDEEDPFETDITRLATYGGKILRGYLAREFYGNSGKLSSVYVVVHR
jgi:hypothetical protein